MHQETVKGLSDASSTLEACCATHDVAKSRLADETGRLDHARQRLDCAHMSKAVSHDVRMFHLHGYQDALHQHLDVADLPGYIPDQEIRRMAYHKGAHQIAQGYALDAARFTGGRV